MLSWVSLQLYPQNPIANESKNSVFALFYLEGHVLQEVSSAVVLGVLSTGTGIDEDTDGGSLGRGVSLGGDGQTVLEGGDAGGGSNLGSSDSGKRTNSLDDLRIAQSKYVKNKTR